MLPEHFYFTGAGLLGYLLYVPVVVIGIGLLYGLLLRHIGAGVLRWGTTVTLAVTLLSLPFWDVLAIGYEADKLCKEQGGLHVYKTVEAEGFYGSSGIKYWSKYGFRYVESGKTAKGISHWTLANGEVQHRYIPEPTSRYQWKGAENHIQVAHQIERSSSHVIDRQTGEVLGDLVYFSIDPGWFDRLFLGLLPVEFNPWICGDEVPADKRVKYGKRYGIIALIKATLKPPSIGGNQS